MDLLKRSVDKRSATIATVIMAIFVVAICVITLCVGYNADSVTRGTFGDMFGAANALFSGMAFLGVVYAVMLQRIEVAISKEELDRTKKILEDQEGALKVQNLNAEASKFENTFFNLLSTHVKIVESLDIRQSGTGLVIHSGRDCFKYFVDNVNSIYNTNGRNEIAAYEAVYQRYRSDLGHYFRFLYRLYLFLDASTVANKNFYAKIVRSQMSDFEVVFIFLNGLTERGQDFKVIMEKYALLKMLDDKLYNDKILKDRYNDSAFSSLPD